MHVSREVRVNDASKKTLVKFWTGGRDVIAKRGTGTEEIAGR